MSRCYIILPVSIFHSEAKAFLDGCMKDKPLGITYHIDIKQPTPSPFSKQEVQDQIRACYGRDNKEIHFTTDGQFQYRGEPKGLNIRKTSQQLLERFFLNNDLLVLGEVPREVHHWLMKYREDNHELMEYLKRVIR